MSKKKATAYDMRAASFALCLLARGADHPHKKESLESVSRKLSEDAEIWADSNRAKRLVEQQIIIKWHKQKVYVNDSGARIVGDPDGSIKNWEERDGWKLGCRGWEGEVCQMGWGKEMKKLHGKSLPKHHYGFEIWEVRKKDHIKIEGWGYPTAAAAKDAVLALIFSRDKFI